MKQFVVTQLERAIDLYEHVEAHRWEVPNMPEPEQQLHSELWTFKARAMLESGDLAEPDRQACLWVLGVVRGIAAQAGIYIHGLSRDHTDNWHDRARAVGARIRARQERQGIDVTQKSQRTPQTVPGSAPEPLPYLAGLAGATIVVIGGEPDNVLLTRFRDADFTLDWTPANVRQVQAMVERIKLGKVSGVIFLADLNRHASFYLVRDACRISATPMTLGTKGLAGLKRALGQLSDKAARKRRSA